MAKKPPPKQRRRFRSGLMVRGGLIAATLGAGGALAYIPVTQYIELRTDMADADREAEELAEARREAIARLTDSRRRNHERARCFNMWVEVGEETYSVSGLLTCDD